jgi:hypothetical protein
MQKKCKVCGVGIGIPSWTSRQESSIFFPWTSRRGSSDYCSVRCNLIGNAKYTFVLAVILGVITIGLILTAIFTSYHPALVIFGAMSGLLAIILSVLSALGFYFKTTLGY